MNKKYRLKKSAIIIILLFVILLIASIFFVKNILKTKSYSVDYNIEKCDISENYDNQKNQFYFEISYDNVIYDFIYNSKYQKEKKLIKEIKKYEDNSYVCLVIISPNISVHPLCSLKSELIDYHLVSNGLKEKLSEYYNETKEYSKKIENYTLYTDNASLLVWSYKGFNFIEKSKNTFLKIFDKDIYEIPHATKINEYIFIPNYEQEHNFNEAFIINLKNKKIEKWELKYDISFDSYVPGINNESIFLVDKKNKIQYELVPHKKKMRIVAQNNNQGIFYENGTSKKVSINRVVSKEPEFIYYNDYQYKLKNKTLYMSYFGHENYTKISNLEIDTIVHINRDKIYYLVKDTLYKYDLKYGETKIINYSEWKFNNNNLIFIND